MNRSRITSKQKTELLSKPEQIKTSDWIKSFVEKYPNLYTTEQSAKFAYYQFRKKQKLTKQPKQATLIKKTVKPQSFTITINELEISTPNNQLEVNGLNIRW